MKLTKRQQTIFDAIPRVNTLADVGCDHGYVGMTALVTQKANFVHFCDISAPSLSKAQDLATKLGQKNCSFTCQDGLQTIKCDCAVIAGMGGLETISILSNTQTLPKLLVLQPMKNQYDLRKFLCKNYQILLDFKFFDKKYYDLIVATQGSDTLTETELCFGKTNLALPGKDFVNYLKTEQNKYKQILTKCNDQGVVNQLNLLNDVLNLVNGGK